MQKRDISPKALIALPRLSAAEMVVLMTMVLAAAEAFVQKSGPLPLMIERARKRLAQALSALAARVAAGDVPDAPNAVPADRRLDRAWSALMDLLSAWQKLPGSKHPDALRGAQLFDLLFSKGLAFTKIRFKLQWQESEGRLSALERENFEPLVHQLGGKVFLDELREAHAAYGEVLGVTGPAPEEDPKVRELMEAGRAVLQDYLAKVDAYVDPEEAGSAELAEALGEPVRSWEGGGAGTKKDNKSEGGGQGTP